jgi:hypothetical protein
MNMHSQLKCILFTHVNVKIARRKHMTAHSWSYAENKCTCFQMGPVYDL